MTPIGSTYVAYGGWGYGGMQTREEGNKRAGADSVVVLDSETMEWEVPEVVNPNPMVHMYVDERANLVRWYRSHLLTLFVTQVRTFQYGRAGSDVCLRGLERETGD